MQEILSSNKKRNIHYTPAANSWKQAIGEYLKMGCYLKIIQNPLSWIRRLSAINSSILIIRLEVKVKVKVKCILVQTLKLCTCRTAHRGSRGIALPFLEHGPKRGWGVSVTPRPHCTPGKTGYPLYRRLSGHQGRSGQVRKISPTPEIDPRTVQPVTSRYTDWANGIRLRN